MRTLVFLACCFLSAVASAAPDLVYSTYLRANFHPNVIATDPAGNIYLAGDVLVDEPARQTIALIVKLNPQADHYLYTRYLGGSVYDSATAIAVDAAGNAFVAGRTASPDFPVTAGAALGTPATGISDQRSFLTKLDPTGNTVFSTLLGGSAASVAQAIALTPSKEIVVGGTVQSTGFPVTPGAINMPLQSDSPYLLKLDAAGKDVLFSAAGVGGSSIVVDAIGNIYVAGTTRSLDYPTTPGAYQPTFPTTSICTSPSCLGGFPGANQYVSKIDPMGSHLIYSTALTGMFTSVNNGLAVDNAGNAYVTGFAGEGYPYTLPPGTQPFGLPFEILGTPFVSKLDPSGSHLLFSLPTGGVGVGLGADGSLYAGGQLGFAGNALQSYAAYVTPPSFEDVPPQCLPNRHGIRSSAYAAQIDPLSGMITNTQFVGGATLALTGTSLTGLKLWLTGTTDDPQVPLVPGPPPPYVVPGTAASFGAGAYLGAIDFTPFPFLPRPRIACILDGADFSPVSVPARLQVLSVFGSNLGPEQAAGAGGQGAELAGVRVDFGNMPATLLYASATQLNLAVPVIPGVDDSSPLTVTFDGTPSLPRKIWLTGVNPHFFLNADVDVNGMASLVALNPDGSQNSPQNPAPAGSVVSVFVNGLVPNPTVISSTHRILARGNWRVVSTEPATPFVTQIKVEVPPIGEGAANALSCPDPEPGSLCSISLQLFFDNGIAFQPENGGWIYTRR